MTAPDAAQPEVKDFTKRRPPIVFRIEPDEFRAPSMLGGYTLQKIGALYTNIASLELDVQTDPEAVERVVNVIADAMRLLMPGPSGKRFAERLLSDGDPGDPEADPPRVPAPPPIDLMGEAMPAFFYLIEAYGLRPTLPPSALPAGSAEAPMAETPSVPTSSEGGVSPSA